MRISFIIQQIHRQFAGNLLAICWQLIGREAKKSHWMKKSGFNRIKQEFRDQLAANLEKRQSKKQEGRILGSKKSTNAQPGERDCSSKQQPKLKFWSLKLKLPGLVNGF